MLFVGKTFVYRKGEVKFRTYFSRIVQSQAVDMIRRNAKQKDLPGELPENPAPFEELFMTEWRKAVLEEAKAELRLRVTPKTYQAYELYVLQGQPENQRKILAGRIGAKQKNIWNNTQNTN